MPVSDAQFEFGERAFLAPVADVPFEIPEKLTDLVERAYPQKPPTFFESPLPQTVSYHYLDVPGDVSMVLRADKVNIDFVGIKMGASATLGFKKAVDLSPAVITCSWGWDISAGGVYAHRDLAGDDFDLEASDYASSFVSKIYPGRGVPDLCGLVGMKPRGIYIMLPLQPKCSIDSSLSGGTYPNGDMTQSGDGWAVISGTSAAAPQIAGVCALLKQAQPSLSPALVKQILIASARDVKKGKSQMGDKAGKGSDSATGAGLVDAYKAYRLARSI